MDQWSSTAEHSPAAGSPASTGGWASTADHAQLPSAAEQIGTSLKNQSKGLFDTLSSLVDPQLSMNMGDAALDAQFKQWDKAKEEYKAGNYGNAIHRALAAFVPGIGPGLENAAEKLQTPGQRAEGATDIFAPLIAGAVLKGGPAAVDAVADTTPVRVAGAAVKEGVKAGGPDVALGAAKIAGGAALDGLGVPYHVGAAMGATRGVPQILRGVGKGVKAGYEAGKEAANRPQPEAAVVPLPESRQIAAPTAIVTPPPADTSGVIPNWQPTILEGGEAPAPAAAPISPEAALDAIAQRFGAKDYASSGKALQELAVKIHTGDLPVTKTPPPAQSPATATPAPVTPPPTVQVGGGGPLRPPLAQPEPTDIGVHGGVEGTPIPAGPELTDKLNNLLRQARTDAGADPDLHLGHEKGAVYQNRFGSGDSPVIDSSKRRIDSTSEIANPGKILTKKAFRDSLPPNSPLLKADAFEKAYKLAVELKSQGVPISQ